MASQAEKLTREDAATLHIQLWMTALCRTLRAAVHNQSSTIASLRGARGPNGTITPKHAGRLLNDLENRLRHGPPPLPEIVLSKRERGVEEGLRRDAPMVLPLDYLEQTTGLGEFDKAALLIAVAGEIAPEFAQLAGYVSDDLAHGQSTVDLVLALTRGKGSHDGWRLRRLGPGGPLRRLGLLSADPGETVRTTALTPAHGVTEWLLGARIAPPVLLSDPQMIWPGEETVANLADLAPAIRCLSRTANGAAGVWGGEVRRHDDIAALIASGTARPVFHVALDACEPAALCDQLRGQAEIAAGAGAILWIETSDIRDDQSSVAARVLSGLSQRVLLSGRLPWRDTDVIRTRPYADVVLPPVTPPVESGLPGEAGAWNAHHRLGYRQRKAALCFAHSEQRNLANGTVPALAPILERAARLVAAPAHMASVSVITPERRLDELVLPDELHRQISEIATFFDKASMVDAAWGFGRMTGSDGALKVLFTGDPGTGKTMAAEAISERAGVSLVKVDLSQIVSKWVGETEKNLESVFAHAENARAAIFFDEAEALFGKRGNVQRGTDRYANMEVSFLLQRLESFSGGLVILASNLKGDIDPAFSRRFQVSLDFPRPGPEERLRLWQMAFRAAPVDPDLNLEQLADLDLTGGAIVTSARMAALLAAGEGAKRITAAHLGAATERQFRKEARLMGAGQSDSLSIARARI